MKDSAGIIIYIGKASSLKKRVLSYFQKKDHDNKTRVLIKLIRDIEYIITDSEMEALILESNLIKKHKPKFNVRQKDDKRYPYIAVTMDEEYPRILYTRNLREKGWRYFGPYTDAKAAKNSVNMINRIFKLKLCRKELPLKKNERPCMNFQINRCSGVCTGRMTSEEYRAIIDGAISLLEGRIEPVIENLHRLMRHFSEKLEYEKASDMRDMIYDIQKTSETQKVTVSSVMDQDYIGMALIGSEALLVIFEFRSGVLLGRKISVYENTDYSDPEDIIKSFILSYYERSEVPQRIVVRHSLPDRALLQQYLTGKSNRKTSITMPESGDDRGIMNLLQKNIDIIIADRKAEEHYQSRETGLNELKEVLDLDTIPSLMECFDISNLQGSDAVASMVSFKEGVPYKSGYRRYRIRGYDSPNDPGMIHEVVARRIQYLLNEEQEIPDLMIIDGGVSQLSRALEAAGNFDVPVKIISIAKRMEEIYLDPGKDPIRLPPGSPALHIIQQIRDEAHRFAINYHRKIRDKKTSKSELDSLQVSKKVKVVLLRHFKSVPDIKKASVEDIEKLPGIGEKTARKIFSFFHEG